MERKQTHLVYGAVTGLIIVVIGVILYVSGLGFEPWSQWITYIPFLIGLILNANAYAKANDHYVTYGNVWSSCFKASAIVALIALAWAFISIVVFPEMREQGLEIAREKMAGNPNMGDEQIDAALEMTEKYFVPLMIAGILFNYMFFGAILSLIAAAIPKKKGDGMRPDMQ